MTVSLEIDAAAAVAQIWLDRPDALNALDEPTRKELLRCLIEAEESSEARVVVLSGRGRAFCVGQDLGASEELVDAGRTVRDTYNPIVQAITSSAKPFVAAVHGAAVGAGMGLALACDVVVMAEPAFFSCAFSKVALVPDTGSTLALVRTVGYLRAFEIATSARRISSGEALELGLATTVVDLDEVEPTVAEFASGLAAGPALAQQLTKRLLRSIDQEALDRSLAAEADGQGQSARHSDHAEGAAAFHGRRPPRFA